MRKTLDRSFPDGAELFAGLDDGTRRLLVRDPQPEWIDPMLATLTHDYFSADGWILERKLDGERMLSYCTGSEVTLLSRNRLRLTATYPEITDALSDGRAHDVVLDGEVVALVNGATDFNRLQQRFGINDADIARRSPIAVTYFIFDLLHLDGYDIRSLPLHVRKSLLQQCITFHGPLVYTEHRDRDGEAFLEEACRLRWEGLIAKRADSAYVSKRSPDWLKFKCSGEQELVVGGFTDPQRSRVGLGALLLGYYEGATLVYAGKVGTGFDTKTLLDLRARLDRLEQTTTPFSSPHRIRERGVHWVKPELVAQIGFSEWTPDGLLRHPRYLGLRDDKAARDVVREDRGA
ncbi:MAG: non-homologous end-joining DNA ligase [Candidatus Dormibacteraeota bacterium]|nr:non-homologous end-joining DNA ligase [Candidatus Dormibacteraeota bacterium]